jgi:endo-1,4-beta-xylanase
VSKCHSCRHHATATPDTASELDVDDDPRGKDIPERDMAIADEAERFLDVALAQKNVTTLITWGLSDRYTWWHDASNPYLKRRPLLPRQW